MASKKSLTTIESLDTNIILRLLLQDIPDQYDRAITLMEHPNVTYHISDFALLEVVFVLTNLGIDRETIASALLQIISRPNIKANNQIIIDTIYLYIHHPKLSFADCYLSIESGLNNAEPLWTFDQSLAKSSPTAKLL